MHGKPSTVCVRGSRIFEGFPERFEGGRYHSRENGWLVDFFDTGALAERVCDALDRPGAFAHLRDGARRTAVERYAAARLVPLRARLLEAVADGLKDG